MLEYVCVRACTCTCKCVCARREDQDQGEATWGGHSLPPPFLHHLYLIKGNQAEKDVYVSLIFQAVTHPWGRHSCPEKRAQAMQAIWPQAEGEPGHALKPWPFNCSAEKGFVLYCDLLPPMNPKRTGVRKREKYSAQAQRHFF